MPEKAVNIARFDLSDEEWAVIAPLLPKKWRGPARKDGRNVLNGIFYILRTGAPWRDLPIARQAMQSIAERGNDMGRTRASTTAMFDGGNAVFGRVSSKRWPANVRMC